MSQFVDEGLAVKRHRGGADAAARSHRNVERHRVGRKTVIGRKISRGDIEARGGAGRFFVHGGFDFPRDRPAIVIQRGA